MVVPPQYLQARMTKTALRRDFRAGRKAFVAALADGERQRLERALAEMIAPALTDMRAASSYAAMDDEIDPVWIEGRLAPLGFPRVSGPDIEFHRARRADLRPGAWNIPEPAASAPLLMPDLLLVPLLAVTLAGVRLGQGKGYYDRALARLRQQGPVIAIGLAWDCQIAPALPADPWDAPLDMIATPSRLVRCAEYR